ncbi:MAG TPA: FAD-dependent monooxygenase [Steroidobacteraceae bacterium]|jgi:2-polyprenyl-6-methoxyphenol hydroxylase-like FAD-dependent oxidoreductase
MSDIARDTEVLIVGAGPVGLFLANECARRGLHARLIEARPMQSVHSRALAIFPRTLEIFDMAGVAAPFLAIANRVTSVAIASRNQALAQIPFTPEQSPYPFIAMVPQNVTEQLLAEAFERRGGCVEYQTTFVSAQQQSGSLLVHVDSGGRQVHFRARVLIGCDGAHSAVRHWLNIPFAGAQYTTLFLLADIEANDALPADQLQLCPSEFGPVAIFPISATRRRIVATIDDPIGEVPSLELVQKIVRQRAPKGFEAHSLHWSSYFKVQRRHAAGLQVGAAFIAGDAAHIHSPFGGQGMNTGLHDVWNLVWKLDLFLRGHSPRRLLDTYSAERLPVIKNVIATTDRLTKVLGAQGKMVQTMRNAIIPVVSRLEPFQHRMVQRLSELGISYAGSSLVDGSGMRYLEPSMRGGKGILSRFVLFVGSANSPTTKMAAEAMCRAMGDVAECRVAPGQGVALVRPDGYSAYASSRDGGAPMLTVVRALLKRQTHAQFSVHAEAV